MAMKKLFLASILCLLFSSCRKEHIDNDVIFYSNYERYIGGEPVFGELLTGGKSAYDDVLKMYWTYDFEEEKVGVFREIAKEGFVRNTVRAEGVNGVHGGRFFVTNGIALISTNTEGNNSFLLVNLIDHVISAIITTTPKHDVIIGFSGDFIFSEKWYYDLNEKKIQYYPDYLSFCIYMPAVDTIMAVKDKNHVVLFNYRQGSIVDTGVTINLDRKYGSYALLGIYYMGRADTLYFIKRKRRNLLQFFYNFILPVNPVNWYRYDMKTETEILIKAPSDFSVILGSISSSS
jgi:hypothetical protein